MLKNTRINNIPSFAYDDLVVAGRGSKDPCEDFYYRLLSLENPNIWTTTEVG